MGARKVKGSIKRKNQGKNQSAIVHGKAHTANRCEPLRHHFKSRSCGIESINCAQLGRTRGNYQVEFCKFFKSDFIIKGIRCVLNI
jgi:hypothetical protein